MAKLENLILIVVALGLVYGDDSYSTKYDNVDLEEVLGSERLLENYVKCLKGTGPCTPDGSEVKRIIPEVLQNNCAKCQPQHKERAKKVVSNLIKNHKEIWEELRKIYDPTNEFTEKYKKEYSELVEN